MMEMKIKVEMPELAAAIIKLAEVLPNLNILTPDEPMAPTAPATPPAAPAPSVVPTAPTAPMTPPAAPVAPPAAPAVPTAEAPAYTLDQIARAGAALVDAGKMEPLLALLSRYGVAAITQLKPEQYGAFATELRGLGAQI